MKHRYSSGDARCPDLISVAVVNTIHDQKLLGEYGGVKKKSP